MTAAGRCGLPVPEFRLSDDGRLFIMKRFDITEDGKDLGFEDMCVLQGLGSDGKYEGTYERIVKSIDSCVSPRHRGVAKDVFFASFVLSFALRKFGTAHCGLSQARIREIFASVETAVGETRSDVRRYAADHPAFRETADRMLSAWEQGLEDLAVTGRI